jgi:hypothetical protein
MGEENSKKDVWTRVEQEMWRIRTEEELHELCRDLGIDGLEWIGHQVSLDHGRVVKKIFEGKVEGRRRGEYED